jgi:hypothetical protein
MTQVPADQYVRKETRATTVQATHALHHLGSLEGTWWYAGPFDNTDRKGFDTVYEPEKGVELKAKYTGKDGASFGWTEFKDFKIGEVNDLRKLFPKVRADAVVYLYHEFEGASWHELPLSLGADDSLSLWCNGNKLLHEDHERAAAPGQYECEYKVRGGKNTLLLKVCQYGGEWAVYVAPEPSPNLPEAVRKRIERDHPAEAVTKKTEKTAALEAKHYRISTIKAPAESVLEVGGLAFRPDGKLLICTRRGDIWLLHNPLDDANWKFTRFASGLHEPLGMHIDSDGSVLVVQRPELTRVIDRDGDGVAEEFVTVCDKWGVSGGYHEYAFGPVLDKNHDAFIPLNVGFSSGGQSPVPWRGWCVKVSMDGRMEPWAYGLRSPNGIVFNPDGELFYSDNQGEWVATNKLQHLKKGKFYGHQASLQWVKDSPFASQAGQVKSGLRYDGEPMPNGDRGFPEVDPPVIWFPYGRMGQSASEPKWDTTAGQFGPFAGQCFVGDQTRAVVMRCSLEKVDGVWQGACHPFRNGFQCGVNRIAFAPDGSLFVGETARGWGGLGGKPHGLERLRYTGQAPFEIHTMTITPEGFELKFTQPADVKTLTLDAFAVKSYTYVYHSTYGCPETDIAGEKVIAATPASDGKSVRLTVPNRKPGRVYDMTARGVRTGGGEPLLHAEAYYTVNRIPK